MPQSSTIAAAEALFGGDASMAAPSLGLYLLTPPLEQPSAFMPRLARAVAEGDIACVLLRADRTLGREQLIPLVQLVQASGAACLIEHDPARVRQLAADGLHVAQRGKVLAEALADLKPEYIVGAGSLVSRDDAMRVGESGVDYLKFGEPRADGSIPPLTVTVEQIAWWSEIFTVPCVGFAPDMRAAAELAASGAEFVALGEFVWNDPRGPAAAVAAAQQLLRLNGRPSA
jgi:thiamine-phosphate pyrophosphorylase